MAKHHRTYETAFIVNAGLDDPQIEAVIEKAKEVITKNGGTIVEVDQWGRKRFAFPIRKKNNGFYVICVFEGTGDTVAKLERHYQLDESVLRYLTIVLDKNALKSRAQKAAEKKAEAEAAEAPAPAEATA